jgi:HAD superfamily hydrolase (TIGR01509 family)
MLRAVIFDVDGTLVDNNMFHIQAWVRAFSRFGVQVDPEEVRRQIGKGGDQLLPIFLSPPLLERIGEKIEVYKEELYRKEYLPQVKAFPKIRDLFLRIRQNGVRIALASSASKQEIENSKEIANIADLIDCETTKDDVERSKPHPDVFAVALQKLNVDADEAIAVGDTPYDAEACSKIHVRTIGLTCGGWRAGELRSAGCIEVFRDPADLLANFAKSSLDEGRVAA